MKKQILLAVVMIITAICLCTNNQNCLNACVKKAADCSVNLKKEIKINTTGFVEAEDASFYIFMNPITQL